MRIHYVFFSAFQEREEADLIYDDPTTKILEVKNTKHSVE